MLNIGKKKINHRKFFIFTLLKCVKQKTNLNFFYFLGQISVTNNLKIKNRRTEKHKNWGK